MQVVSVSLMENTVEGSVVVPKYCHTPQQDSFFPGLPEGYIFDQVSRWLQGEGYASDLLGLCVQQSMSQLDLG
jgi:hypothetical protein